MSYGQNNTLPLNLTSSYTTTCNLLFSRCKKLYSPKNVYDHMLCTIYCSLQHIWPSFSQFWTVFFSSDQLRPNCGLTRINQFLRLQSWFLGSCHIWQPVAVAVAVQKRKKTRLNRTLKHYGWQMGVYHHALIMSQRRVSMFCVDIFAWQKINHAVSNSIWFWYGIQLFVSDSVCWGGEGVFGGKLSPCSSQGHPGRWIS